MVAEPAVIQDEYKEGSTDILKLVIRCYAAAIEDLREAKGMHGKEHSREAAYEKIRHAQDVITELLVGLDYERGGSIAQNLGRIYNFILRELIVIHTKKTTEIYDQLIRILEDLKGAWEQISS